MNDDGLTSALAERLRTSLGLESGDSARTSIAEIFQHHLPYRIVRSEMGVLEFAAYEHAVLRLLAGQKDLVEVLDTTAREEIRRELASPNPILGIYRDYADAPVAIRPPPSLASSPDTPSAAGAEPSVEDSNSLSPTGARAPGDLRGAGEQAMPSGSPGDLRGEGPEGKRGDSASVAAPAARCNECRRDMPGGESDRFCPFCGAAQRPRICLACSLQLADDWRYCTRCGSEAPPY